MTRTRMIILGLVVLAGLMSLPWADAQQKPTAVQIYCEDPATSNSAPCIGGTEATNGLNSAGTGITATQIVGQYDDTGPQTVTENQFGNLRMSSQGVLYGQIRDAAGNGRGANVNASNELNVALSSVPSHNVTNAGTFATQAAQSGTWTVQPGNTANTTPWLVSRQPATSGGTSISRTVAAASTNATNVKSSAGQVYQIIASNVSASARFVHLYNTSGSPTCNASIIATFIVPGQTTGAGTNIQLDPGVAFGTGIGFCITSANDGTGSVSAGDVVLNVVYK